MLALLLASLLAVHGQTPQPSAADACAAVRSPGASCQKAEEEEAVSKLTQRASVRTAWSVADCAVALQVCAAKSVVVSSSSSSSASAAARFDLVVQLHAQVQPRSAALFVYAEPAYKGVLSPAPVPVTVSRLDVLAGSATPLASGAWSVSLTPSESVANATFGIAVDAAASGRVFALTAVLLDVVAISALDAPAAPKCRAYNATTFYSLSLPSLPAGQPLRLEAHAVAPLFGVQCLALHGFASVRCLRDQFYEAPMPTFSLLHDNAAGGALDGAALRVCAAEAILVDGAIRDCDTLALEAGFVSWWAAARFLNSSDAAAWKATALALWSACPTTTNCGATACRQGVVAGATISRLLASNGTLADAHDVLCNSQVAGDERSACVAGLGGAFAALASNNMCRPFNSSLARECASTAARLSATVNTTGFVEQCVGGGFEALHRLCAFDDAALASDETAFAAFSAHACNITADAATIDACNDALARVVALRANFNSVRVPTLCNNATACIRAANAAVAAVVARSSGARSDRCAAIRLDVRALHADVPLFSSADLWIPIIDKSAQLPAVWELDSAGLDMYIAMRVAALPTDAPTPAPTPPPPPTPATTTAVPTLGPVPTFVVSPGCKSHCQMFCGSSAAALCVCAGQKIVCRDLANSTDRALHGSSGDVDSEEAPAQQSIPSWVIPLCVLGALALIGVGFGAAALARLRRRFAFSRRRL
jgi:hypothetical protein